MDNKFLFNKRIEYTFIPHLQGYPVTISGITSARLYSTAPTLEQKQNTAIGHIEEVTSGTISSGIDYTSYTLTFSGIDDPNPSSEDIIPYETYYLVINFNHDNYSSSTFVDEVIYLFRPDSFSSYLDTSAQDLIDYENKLNVLDTNTPLERFITNAKEELFQILKGKGFTRSSLFYFTESLKRLHIFKSLELACLSLSSDDNSIWLQKSNIYKDKFNTLLSSLQINVDQSGVDEPLPDEVQKVNIVRVLR